MYHDPQYKWSALTTAPYGHNTTSRLLFSLLQVRLCITCVCRACARACARFSRQHMNARSEDVYALLRARGLVRSRFSLDGLRSSDKATVVDALSTLLTQLDEEAELRNGLLARNQALEAQIDRMRRTHKQDDGRVTTVEARLNQTKAKLQNTSALLAQERAAHRATADELARAQRTAHQSKVAALQHRAATERTTERMRERLGVIAMSNMKSLLPDIRIASTSFEAQECSAEHGSIAEQQLTDLEKRHMILMESVQATKQLVVDAINAMRMVDHHLILAMHPGSRLERACTTSEPPLVAQRDVFPAMHPLAFSDTAATHPAKRYMQEASEALEDRVDEIAPRIARRDAPYDSLNTSAGSSRDDDSAMRLDDLHVSHNKKQSNSLRKPAQRIRVSRDALQELNGSDGPKRRRISQ